ncbi:MAG: M20 family metallopeptidase [Ilumatobacteraceae bacterium]
MPNTSTLSAVRSALEAKADAMLRDVESFVNIESPSHEVDDLRRSAQFLAELMERVLGSRPTLVESPEGPHVHWKGSSDTRVLVVGHHDTVFPKGTVARRSFSRDGDVARGPGIFDMKAGIVQAIYGLGEIEESAHVEILITADEEVGSYASRELIEERARVAGHVLVIEPSADGGALKIGRKGVGTFRVDIEGRASHAGLEPEKGINSLVELAAQVQTIASFARPDVGTTVTPTVASAGTTENVVPASAHIIVDTRISEPAEKARVESAFASLAPTVPGATVTVSGSINRPPMHESAAQSLFALATGVAKEIGVADLRGVSVGGGSDGNFTAAIGIPTLDGCGAVGGGAHAESEHIIVSTMPERAALVAGIARAIVNAN